MDGVWMEEEWMESEEDRWKVYGWREDGVWMEEEWMEPEEDRWMANGWDREQSRWRTIETM